MSRLAKLTSFARALGSRARLGLRCSFCGKAAGERRAVVSAGEANVCAACLGTCREILDNR